MIKLGKKMNVGGNNMNKYDYDNMLSKIRLLEIKLKRIQYEKEYLGIFLCSILKGNRARNYFTRYQNLLNEEEEEVSNHLDIEYENLGKILEKKRK